MSGDAPAVPVLGCCGGISEGEEGTTVHRDCLFEVPILPYSNVFPHLRTSISSFIQLHRPSHAIQLIRNSAEAVNGHCRHSLNFDSSSHRQESHPRKPARLQHPPCRPRTSKPAGLRPMASTPSPGDEVASRATASASGGSTPSSLFLSPSWSPS